MSSRPDWQSLIGRLRERGIDIEARLGVSRTTVWRWSIGEVRPSGDHAATLLELDRPHVSPMQQASA